MDSFKITDGVLTAACEKEAASVVVPAEISAVAAGAFSGFAELCLAEVYAQEVRGYIPADVLILREGVTRLGGEGEAAAEKPLAFLCEYKHPVPVKGAPRIYPIVAMPESLTDFGSIAFPPGTEIIAPAGSAAERFAKEKGMMFSTDLGAAIERKIVSYKRAAEACRKRGAAHNRDISDAQAQLERLQTEELERLSAERRRLENEIASYKEQIDAEKENALSLEQEIHAKEKELSGTFFLNIQKKNELNAEIEELKEQHTAATIKANTLPIKLHAAEVELANPMMGAALKRAEERCGRLAEAAQYFEELAQRMDELTEILRAKLSEL